MSPTHLKIFGEWAYWAWRLGRRAAVRLQSHGSGRNTEASGGGDVLAILGPLGSLAICFKEIRSYPLVN
jgi:hypothetical protein